MQQQQEEEEVQQEEEEEEEATSSRFPRHRAHQYFPNVEADQSFTTMVLYSVHKSDDKIRYLLLAVKERSQLNPKTLEKAGRPACSKTKAQPQQELICGKTGLHPLWIELCWQGKV